MPAILQIDPQAPPQAIAATLAQMPPEQFQNLGDAVNLCRQHRLRERLRGMALQVSSAENSNI